MAEKSCQNAAVRAGADCVEFSGNKRDGDLDCVEKINVGGQVKSFWSSWSFRTAFRIGTGCSFWDRLPNFLHKFTWIDLSVEQTG